MKEEVAGLYNRVASTYDCVGPHVFSHFGRRLVELAEISSGAKVLDVGAGRGASLQIETFVESNPTKLRHTNLSELKLLFRLTGFEIAELYSDVDRRPLTGKSDSDYTIIARRT